MNDYYLKADTETALYNALEAAGVVRKIPLEERTSDHDWVVTDGHKYALDVIGTIYRQKLTESVSDPDMIPVEPVDGFHANLRVINMSDFDSDAIASIIIQPPNNPARGWA